jgi:hypothetical protein
MTSRYAWAGAIGAIGVGVAVAAVLAPDLVPAVALFVPAVASPLAVLLAVWGRVGGDAPVPAAAGGALIGPLVAAASHAFVAAFAYAFFLGFADTGRALVETLRLDPRVVDLVSSPWVVLLIVELVVVAPLTEEAGKAFGARSFGRPGRRDAPRGVAAGATSPPVKVRGAGSNLRWPPSSSRTAGRPSCPHQDWCSGMVGLPRGAGVPTAQRVRGAGVRLVDRRSVVYGVRACWDSHPSPGRRTCLRRSPGCRARHAAGPRPGGGDGRAPDSAARAAWLIVTASLVVPIAVVTIAFPALFG